MAAIITDQLRILNASNFVSGLGTTTSSYYTFIGLPNATEYQSDWDVDPPSPIDNFSNENNIWDSTIALKRIYKSDVRQVIRKLTWQSGKTYDMYRHDISITNVSQPSGKPDLYSSDFYVVNSDYRVYICLNNGVNPENPTGRPSVDEPLFTDLEPRPAGDSGDGYIWKYLYTIKPGDLVKFDSTNYMPVPQEWQTSSENAAVRNNAASSGQLKIVTVRNRGVGLGTANRVYTRVPIDGDGSGAEATVVINNDSKVESVTISKGGTGYTYGTLNLSRGGVPTGTTPPIFDVIIPPKGGHGADIYRELGAYRVLIYSRIENDDENPDFITGNQFSRIGVVQNPLSYSSSSNLTLDKASAIYGLKLIGVGYSSASFPADSKITQTIGLGLTAVGKVISYDQETGVLKYWQDRTLSGFNTDGTKDTSPTYGFKLNRFTSNPDIANGGNLNIVGVAATLGIETNFTGVSTVINSRTYYLGQSFVNGVANPEVEKHSGNIIYVDNRPSVTRSFNQKEDIKIVLQF